MNIKRYIHSIQTLVDEVNLVFLTVRPTQQAAALSYYGLFSLAPMLFIALSVAGLVIDQAIVAGQLLYQIERFLGPEVAQFVYDAIVSIAADRASGSQLGAIIGFLALLYAAGGLFFEMQYSLNAIWEVPPPVKSTWGVYIRRYLFSFILVIGLGLVLTILTMASVLVSAAGDYFDASSRLPLANALVFWLLFTLVFAAFYRFIPEARVHGRSALVGAALAALLLTLGAALLAILFRLGFSYSALAAAGAVAILLTALYYAVQIFLLGAILTRVLGSRYFKAHQG
jgi:membrane protein